MTMRWIAAVLMLMAALRPGMAQEVAQEIAGQSDPAFLAAVESWLQDDEAAALADLGGLAAGGNPAAQVLLGLIDKTPSLQGPYLSGISRAERLALIRAPGGMSGQNWMRLAAAEVPLAALWVGLWSVEAEPGIVLQFIAAGEARAARVAVLALMARYKPGLLGLGASPDYPAAMRFAMWDVAMRNSDLGTLAAQAQAEAAAFVPGDPQRAMAGLADDEMARAAWVQSAAVAEPVDGLCAALCPETADICAETAFAGLGGYRGLMVAGTPSEQLIAAERFAASPKGQSDLLRRILLRIPVSGQASLLARASDGDACFGAALAAEAARYQ